MVHLPDLSIFFSSLSANVLAEFALYYSCLPIICISEYKNATQTVQHHRIVWFFFSLHNESASVHKNVNLPRGGRGDKWFFFSWGGGYSGPEPHVLKEFISIKVKEQSDTSFCLPLLISFGSWLSMREGWCYTVRCNRQLCKAQCSRSMHVVGLKYDSANGPADFKLELWAAWGDTAEEMSTFCWHYWKGWLVFKVKTWCLERGHHLWVQELCGKIF